MKTIAVIQLAIETFSQQANEIASMAKTKREYDQEMNDLYGEFEKVLKHLRDTDPLMSPLLFQEESLFSDSESTMLFNRMVKCAEKGTELGMIFTGTSSDQVVQYHKLSIPKFVNFKENPHVLILPYKDQGWERFAVITMEQIVLGCLMSLPKGKVRVNFVNPSMSDKAQFFSDLFKTGLCRTFIDKEDITTLTNSLLLRIKNVLKNNCSVNNDLPAYEIIVLLDYPYHFDEITESMRILTEQGHQAGIHFVVLQNLNKAFENRSNYDILCNKELFYEFGAFNNADKSDYEKWCYGVFRLPDQPSLLKCCMDYLSEVAEDDSNQKKEFFECGYVSVGNGLNVTIGKPIDKKTMDFCLGQDGHVHSFIIGQTGSGKSVLLHDIILEAIRKYSPEDLQLYLLDCKLGGVEFNRYKGVKHARALLVDNSDIQVILEILRDLRDQMQDRGKLLREAGVQKIDDYNQSHSENRMFRIWVVIDECHVLFEQHATSERKARAEMIDIINKVATEGRSQGVHLIMATQTLANSDIPTAILNNITDRYILTCASIDAEKMWSNSSKLIGNLGVGDVYYHNTTGRFPDTMFHAFYLSKEDAEVQISAAVAKADGHQSNGQFYFNGSQLFHFDQEIIDVIGKVRKENIKACVGKSVSLKQSPVLITLKQELSENILLTGIDERNQSMRTAMDILFSLVASNLKSGLNYKCYVLDFKDDEDGEYLDVLDLFEEAKLINVVNKRDVGSLFKTLVDNIKNGHAEPSLLVILGQQRFRQLKLDAELVEKQNTGNDFFGSNGFVSANTDIVKTYKDALCYILDNGPDYHIHTLLQVDKPDNLLFEDYVTSKFVFKKFRHLVMLRSDEKAAMKMGLPDDIRLDTLNGDPERLRAVYFADGDEGWTLFSPFTMPDKKIISSIIEKE